MKLICAGQSDAGMEFTAKYADYNFCFGKGINTPTACADTVERLQAAPPGPAATSRSYGLFMVITGETDAEAEAKWELYKAGADHEALRWLVEQARPTPSPAGDTNVRHCHRSEVDGQHQHGPAAGLPCRGGAACWTRWRPFPAWPASC